MDLTRFYDKYGLDGERALADKARINPRYIYQMRTGRRRPLLPMLIKLVEASGFELTLADLIVEQIGRKLPPKYWANIGAQPAND